MFYDILPRHLVHACLLGPLARSLRLCWFWWRLAPLRSVSAISFPTPTNVSCPWDWNGFDLDLLPLGPLARSRSTLWIWPGLTPLRSVSAISLHTPTNVFMTLGGWLASPVTSQLHRAWPAPGQTCVEHLSWWSAVRPRHVTSSRSEGLPVNC